MAVRPLPAMVALLLAGCGAGRGAGAKIHPITQNGRRRGTEYALSDEPNDRWRGFLASYLGFDLLRVRSHDDRVRDLDDLVGR